MIKPYYEEPGITIYCGNCADILPELEKVDLILTDPPYDKHTHKGGISISSKDVLAGTGSVGIGEFSFLESVGDTHRSLMKKTDGWCLIFCTVEMLGHYQAVDEDVYIRGGIWDRVSPMPQLTGDRPGQAVEAIAILHSKGRKIWNSGGKSGIWRYGVERGHKQHPTQKPLKLFKHLLSDFSTSADQTILDPFMGSGTTLVAAKELGRKAIGIEISEEYCEIAVNRLKQEVLTFS